MAKVLDESALRAIESFASAETISKQKDAIQSLVVSKSLDAACKNPKFQYGLQILSQLGDVGRVEATAALALAMRVAASAKSARKDIARVFCGLLEREPGSPREMADAKDREYFARAMELASGEWLIPFLGREVVLEENSEHAREALVHALFVKASSIEEVFISISEGFRYWRVETLDIASSRSRRLLRVVDAIQSKLPTSELPAGPNIGDSLKTFFSSAMKEADLPNPERARLAGSILHLTFDVIRLHFSLATEARSFAVIRNLRALFEPASWPESVSAPVRAVARQLEEAIILLAKQGVVDNELREILRTLLGDVSAKHRLASLGRETPGLDSKVRLWLTGVLQGRETAETSVAAEAQLRELETRFAGVFRDAQELSAKLQESLAPTQSLAVIGSIRRLLEQILYLAAERKLRLRGEAGGIVSYLPAEHDIGPSGVGARTVRIVKPLVERQSTLGNTDIILKAEVEPQ